MTHAQKKVDCLTTFVGDASSMTTYSAQRYEPRVSRAECCRRDPVAEGSPERSVPSLMYDEKLAVSQVIGRVLPWDHGGPLT